MIRASYELFDLLKHFCVCVPHLWQEFAFSFMPQAMTLKIKFLQFHIIGSFLRFDWHV